MKIMMKRLVLFLLISLSTASFFSCSSSSSQQTAESEIVDKEHNSKYICPMYCEGSGSQKPGDCPVCHMHYVENKDYQAPKE